MSARAPTATPCGVRLHCPAGFAPPRHQGRTPRKDTVGRTTGAVRFHRLHRYSDDIVSHPNKELSCGPRTPIVATLATCPFLVALPKPYPVPEFRGPTRNRLPGISCQPSLRSTRPAGCAHRRRGSTRGWKSSSGSRPGGRDGSGRPNRRQPLPSMSLQTNPGTPGGQAETGASWGGVREPAAKKRLLHGVGRSCPKGECGRPKQSCKTPPPGRSTKGWRFTR